MSKTAKAAAGLLIFTFLSKGLGFLRDILIASKYGASSLNDVYIISQNIAVLLFSVVAAAVMTGYMPLYMSVKSESPKRAMHFTAQLFIFVTAIAGGIMVLGWLFMPYIVKLFAVGFTGDKFQQTVYYARILSISIIFTGAASVLRAFHQANGRYVLSTVNALVSNVIVLSVLFFSSPKSVFGIVLATLCGMCLDFFVQGFFARKEGFKLEGAAELNNPYLKRFFIVVIPIVIGTMIGQVSIIIDSTMASTLPDGSITYINTAFKLLTFVNGIFAVSLGTVVYPMLSSFSASENMQAYKWSLKKAVNMILLTTVPIMVLTMVLSVPVVQLLFERGKFDHADTRATAAALVCFAAGMIGLGLREVLSKAYYSLQDTKTPMINGAIAIAVNVTMNFALIGPLKHAGLALASSFAVTVTTLLLITGLRRKLGRINGRLMLKALVKNLIAGAVMGLSVWIFDYYFTGFLSRFAEVGGVDHKGLILELVVDTLLGLVVYMVMAYWLKIDEFLEIYYKAKKKLVMITKI